MNNKTQKKKIICLMGPTCTGKTNIGVKLVQALPLDIISVDSAMIYRGMDIGTAKPSVEILKQAPHRLIDILAPEQRYNVAEFCKDSAREIALIHDQGKIPLLLGGTMMYFRAIRDGLADLPDADESVRNKILLEAEDIGWEALHARLELIDNESYHRINKNDPQRIQRALEVYAITGKSLSDQIALQAHHSPYELLFLAVMPSDRGILHKAIEKRFKQMLTEGFVEEVKTLRKREGLSLDHPSMRCVGYRQIWEYLDNLYTHAEMVEKGIAATRQLAKRQHTWLSGWPLLNVFDSLHENCYPRIEERIAQFMDVIQIV